MLNVSLSLLTFKRLCDEPLEVVHVFWVFCLGIPKDVPVLSSSKNKMFPNTGDITVTHKNIKGVQTNPQEI